MFISIAPNYVQYDIEDNLNIRLVPESGTLEIKDNSNLIVVEYDEIDQIIDILSDCQSLIEEQRKEKE